MVEYWKWLLLFGSVIKVLLEQASFNRKDTRYHEGTATQRLSHKSQALAVTQRCLWAAEDLCFQAQIPAKIWAGAREEPVSSPGSLSPLR